MSMAGDYIQAHKAMADIVEGSFRKMAKHCEFGKTELNTNGCGSFGHTEMIIERSRRRCHYKNGSTNSGVCAREICPILEEK